MIEKKLAIVAEREGDDGAQQCSELGAKQDQISRYSLELYLIPERRPV
jgi:hypothetical protein